LQIIPFERAANSLYAPSQHLCRFRDCVRGEVLAQRIDLIIGPTPVFVANLQAGLHHKPPAGLSRTSAVPLQATNELIELFTGQCAGLRGDRFGLIAPRTGGVPIQRSRHWAPQGTEMRIRSIRTTSRPGFNHEWNVIHASHAKAPIKAHTHAGSRGAKRSTPGPAPGATGRSRSASRRAPSATNDSAASTCGVAKESFTMPLHFHAPKVHRGILCLWGKAVRC